MQRRLSPPFSSLLQAGLHMEGVCQEGSNGRGDQRNMQERLQGARPLSVDLVQMVHRRVQLDAVGQCLREPFAGLVEAPVESGARDTGHLKLKVGPQDVSLVDAPRHPCRAGHGPDEYAEVQLSLPLNYT
jgi:hypothetical protein